MHLDIVLERGRFDFLSAAKSISGGQAGVRPSRDAWSALECIEHVIAVESRYLDWIVQRDPITPHPDSQRELRLFTMVRSRLIPVQCPDRFSPQGLFRELDTALAEFHSIRDRGVQAVRDLGESLYSIGAHHPFFGVVNGVEIVQLIDGHARRHAEQIRETCAEFSAL